MKKISCGIIPYKEIFGEGIFILLAKRNFRDKQWGFVKGKMEKEDNNNKKNCAIREVEEEIGIKIYKDHLERIYKQENLTKDIYLFPINWKYYEDKKFKLQKEEIAITKWFNILELPYILSNQSSIVDRYFIDVHTKDFGLKEMK